MDLPTIKQALGSEEYFCPGCLKEDTVPSSDRKAAISELVDRLEALEKALKIKPDSLFYVEE